MEDAHGVQVTAERTGVLEVESQRDGAGRADVGQGLDQAEAAVGHRGGPEGVQ